jgi:hypothetical protein
MIPICNVKQFPSFVRIPSRGIVMEAKHTSRRQADEPALLPASRATDKKSPRIRGPFTTTSTLFSG